ncbi:MAG TPA: regulatory protein RecX [Gammaproteobacteria bacterium]|nr:regulatory protein RecX [Gammaproteobacteria bacterium]
MSDDPAVVARGRALAALARREHSRQELERKLTARGLDAGVVGETLDRLAEQRLQDDERFVEVFVRSRIARGQGPVRIAQELRQRGIVETTVRDALAAAEVDWDALATQVLGRQFRARAADAKTRARQQRFLEYRGFTAAQIRAALRAAGRDPGEVADEET